MSMSIVETNDTGTLAVKGHLTVCCVTNNKSSIFVVVRCALVLMWLQRVDTLIDIRAVFGFAKKSEISFS